MLKKIDNNKMWDETEFNKNPNLKYKLDITKTNSSEAINNNFEVYVSIKDNKEYLISPNAYNYNLDIFTLFDNKLLLSLKGHINKIRTIRYFNNKIEDYLLSTDEDELIVWEMTNNYNIKHRIKNSGNVFSCLLFFNNNDHYIISSANSTSHDYYKSGTKIYSFNNGKYIRYIKNSNYYHIKYLLPWLNRNNNKYYIVQFASNAIVINDLLEDELYSELINDDEGSHFSGCIISKDNKEYLCSSSWNGYINIWDLYDKKIFKTILINNCYLTSLIKWNNKYLIVADYGNKSIKIINIEEYKLICDIKGQYYDNLLFIKKINHPIYGESLLSSSKDNIIKLWTI